MKKRTRKLRPQLKNLLGLKSLLPDYSHASQEKHFKIRARERGFDLDLIPEMWNGMLWRPGDHDRWLVELAMNEQDLLWSLTIDFDETDRPVFVTVCDRSLKALGCELRSISNVSAFGTSVLGGN